MVLGSNGVTATTLIGNPRVVRVTYRIVAGSKAATETGGKVEAPAREGRMRYTNVRAGGSLSTSSGNGRTRGAREVRSSRLRSGRATEPHAAGPVILIR